MALIEKKESWPTIKPDEKAINVNVVMGRPNRKETEKLIMIQQTSSSSSSYEERPSFLSRARDFS